MDLTVREPFIEVLTRTSYAAEMTFGIVDTEAIDAADRPSGPCLTSASPMPATAPTLT
jgi:hypothetical protein